MINLKDKSWYSFVPHDISELLGESIYLLNAVETWDEKFHDYSFVVFPAAKGFEGFLKKFFLDLGLISNEDYYGKRFRIGKALNPNLEKELRGKEGVYDKLVNYCQGEDLANQLWDTWKRCRNSLFHWFPDEKTAISLSEAKICIDLVIDTIDMAFQECRIDNN